MVFSIRCCARLVGCGLPPTEALALVCLHSGRHRKVMSVADITVRHNLAR